MRKRVGRYKRNVLKEFVERKRAFHGRCKGQVRTKTVEFWSVYGKIILLLLLIFTIGFIIGGINSAKLLSEEKTEATNYILLFTNSIKTKNIDLNVLIKDAIFGNIKQVLCPWIIGLIVVGIPLIFIYILIEGYMLGFTVTSVISSLGAFKGCTFLISSVIPKQVIFIPLLFIIVIKAIMFSNKLLNERNVSITREFYKYFLILIISLLIAVGIALFEVYVGFPLTKFLL